MKKLLYILTCLTLLCSCSAEKRLAYLLAHHPELHKDSVYVIDTFYTTPADTASTTFTLQDLQNLLNHTDSAALGDSSLSPTVSHAQEAFSTISIENSHSKAAIKPNADGTFTLQAITKTDTLYIHDTIPTPVYYTQYKDKIVYKMNNAQTFFFGLGILFLVLIAIVIGIRIAKFFI